MLMKPGLSPITSRPKLLIIDDEPFNIRVLDDLLRDNFDVFMATDGLRAITMCRDLLPDIILLDIVMPDMDGYEVCRRLKTGSTTADIPVIFITAHFDEAEEVRGFELGAVDFIHKPINRIITRARINNHLLHKQQKDLLRSNALIDGLTGVANRRKFDEDLLTAWAQCAREKTPLSLLMLDVDFFKRYNDRYGHQVGDKCLQLIANTIKNSLQRPYDLTARYGGEEFACILPHTNLKGAAYVAEQILANIRELGIEHLDSKKDHIVTLSAGVASITPVPEENLNALVEVADRQLYLSKHNGRGCVSYL
jgi:diguanylate cyclase (GGDEF)-like protein